jgi:hypothetical protein
MAARHCHPGPPFTGRRSFWSWPSRIRRGQFANTMRARRVGELVPRSGEGVWTGEGGRGADARIGDAIRLMGSCIGLISVARPVPASKTHQQHQAHAGEVHREPLVTDGVALLSRSGHTSSSTPSSRGGREMMRKMIVALVAVGALALGAGPAFGAEHHPPKFGVHSNQCSSDANQPWCPGNH